MQVISRSNGKVTIEIDERKFKRLLTQGQIYCLQRAKVPADHESYTDTLHEFQEFDRIINNENHN